jgi:hypothetical protein
LKIFLFLFITLFTFNVFGQTERKQITGNNSGTAKIYLAKDKGGEAGEEAEVFSTTDVPIYCVVYLDSLAPALVKMNFIAVKVPGVKAETKVISVNFQTDGSQDRVNFTGKPDGFWVAGEYRIDVFIDGKEAGNKTFEIRKATNNDLQPVRSTAIKHLVPAKTKPKTAARAGKN